MFIYLLILIYYLITVNSVKAVLSLSTQLYFLLISLIASFAIVTVTAFKTKRFFTCIFLSAVSGIGSLFAVNILSAISGVSIAVNYLTLSVSAFLGSSGVVALLLSQLMIK